MKISAVLITKNEEATVHNTLDCIGYFDEIIAVDASTDRTREILMDYGARVIEQKPNQFAVGQYGFHPGAAKNYAVQMAKYPYVMCIDGDETVHPDVYSWLQSHTSQLVHIRQVHMKDTMHWYQYGGETVRAGPKERMKFSMKWNTNVVEAAEANAPYCILNWGYAAPQITQPQDGDVEFYEWANQHMWHTQMRMRTRLLDAAQAREGGGTWWEKWGCSTVDEMVQKFQNQPARHIADLPFIVPPTQTQAIEHAMLTGATPFNAPSPRNLGAGTVWHSGARRQATARSK